MDRIEQYKESANKYDLSDELSHFKERFDNSNEFGACFFLISIAF